MKEAVHEYYSCYGYLCDGRDCCEFCNGQHSASYSKESCKADDFGEGFYYGAEWRINSVWHSPDEEPGEREIILAEMAYEDGDTGYEVGWKSILSEETRARIVRWANVDDLLPNGINTPNSGELKTVVSLFK